ncbi:MULTISPECIES: hypothetical protein [unclassified Streptomyces]|uniref:hypothetical protein n=1 Tax=unclassified Streptomyces TaxID=2593676 RepID=UPI004042E0C3
MSTEELTRPHSAEQAGLLVGQAYAVAVRTLAEPIRRPATPTWHWRAAHRAGSTLRAAADRGADAVERRARTAPRQLVDGLRRLWRATWAGSAKAFATRAGTVGFLVWWGWTWAAQSGVSHRPLLLAAAGGSVLVAYAVGKEPAERPLTRREKARQRAAARDLLWAIDRMLQGAHGLHLADLADQITARSTALGTPVKATVAGLRALLEPLGVPIRDQLALDGSNRPGIHAGDWRVWLARHGATTTPRPGPAGPPGERETVTPTREEPLPSREMADEGDPLGPENSQVSDGNLEISARDLGQDEPAEEGLRAPYTDAQLRLLRHARTAIGTARGAHLRDILTTAQAEGDFTDWTVKRLRQALQEAGIRIEDKLWLYGGNPRGILATSLPTIPGETA